MVEIYSVVKYIIFSLVTDSLHILYQITAKPNGNKSANCELEYLIMWNLIRPMASDLMHQDALMEQIKQKIFRGHTLQW